MGVSKGEGEGPPSWKQVVVKGTVVFTLVLATAMGLGYGKAQYDIQHCTGMADTPKCHSDLAKGK